MMKKKACFKNNNISFRRAFTLIEVLIALFVLTVGTIFIFRFLFNSASALKHIENRVRAHFFLNQQKWKAEKIITQRTRLARYTDTAEFNNTPYSAQMNIRNTAGLKDLFRLDINISWKEGKKQKSIWEEENLREK
jgi:prepilin-type N-terminal cleavage/methylation domain-containing protein